jgi:uncharacterized protein
MTDIPGRMNDMDKLNVATQVVFPTLFLIYLTDDTGWKSRLCRAYNRFLAQACAKSGGRIRWVAIPPLKSTEESVKSLNGPRTTAPWVFSSAASKAPGLWTTRILFPIYQAANDLDLPICIHTGAGCPAFLDLFDVERNHTFGHSRVQPLLAFRDIIANKIPEQFPS